MSDNFGPAAYGLILATLDKLEEKNLVSREDGKAIVTKAQETVERLTIVLKQPELKLSSEVLRDMSAISDKHGKRK
jgi:hypothetical protein